MGRVTAVFEDRNRAERAVDELRQMGVGDAHLSFVSKDEQYGEVAEEVKDRGGNIGKGVGVGAAAGALFGVAAALIPGAGPFIAAGALAQALGAVGGGALAGAVVGGTAGGLAGAFAKAGYSREEADYYGGSVERGQTVVVADVSSEDESRVRDLMTRHGGRAHGGSGMSGDGDLRYGGMSERSGADAGTTGMTGMTAGSAGYRASDAGSSGFDESASSRGDRTAGVGMGGMGAGSYRDDMSAGGLSGQIREHMMVHARGAGSHMGAEGVHVGTVDRVEDAQIKLTKADSPDGQHHYIPVSWVERVDAAGNAVILRVDADEVRRSWS